MVDWVVFYHGKKELAAVSLHGLFPGEIRATKELLAHEHGLTQDDISVSLQKRPLRSSIQNTGRN